MEDVSEVAEDYAKYKPRHQYAYIPFGAGAHKCIGYRFAQEEAVITLVKFLQRYEVRLDPEHHSGELVLISSITMTPRDDIWVKVYRRK
jgi:cytochrome P450 family 4